jgi:hypothetical protein
MLAGAARSGAIRAAGTGAGRSLRQAETANPGYRESWPEPASQLGGQADHGRQAH